VIEIVVQYVVVVVVARTVVMVVVAVARVEIGVATVVGTMVVGVDTVLVKDALVAFVVVLFCSCNAWLVGHVFRGVVPGFVEGSRVAAAAAADVHVVVAADWPVFGAASRASFVGPKKRKTALGSPHCFRMQ